MTPPPIVLVRKRLVWKLEDVGTVTLQGAETGVFTDPAAYLDSLFAREERPDLACRLTQANDQAHARIFQSARADNAYHVIARKGLLRRVKARIQLAYDL
jgi:hypothetical protein